MRLFLVIFAVEALAASWIEIQSQVLLRKKSLVEALAASWIEIVSEGYGMWFRHLVEALAASWIEIIIARSHTKSFMSKPLRLRGLKYTPEDILGIYPSRSPCGFVDGNPTNPQTNMNLNRRSPCGFVDGNRPVREILLLPMVEALAASWIEILIMRTQ